MLQTRDLDERNADYCVNWGDSGGLLEILSCGTGSSAIAFGTAPGTRAAPARHSTLAKPAADVDLGERQIESLFQEDDSSIRHRRANRAEL